jgi:nucleoid-associated protein YgaU
MTVQALHKEQLPAPLTLFAAVVLGLPPNPSDPMIAGACRRALSESYRALRTGREPLSSEPWLAYRALYRTWKEHAAAVRPDDRGDELSLLRTLRHRQRAALALRRMVGMNAEATARVIGCRLAEVDGIVARAEASLAKASVQPALPLGELVAMPLAPPPSSPRPPAERFPRLVAAFGILVVLTAALAVPMALRGGAKSTATVAMAHAPAASQAVVLASRPDPAPATSPATVVVRSGDTLWAIAGRTLGSPLRWTEIWSRNRGRRMTTGERLTDPNLIRPGWRLALPQR